MFLVALRGLTHGIVRVLVIGCTAVLLLVVLVLFVVHSLSRLLAPAGSRRTLGRRPVAAHAVVAGRGEQLAQGRSRRDPRHEHVQCRGLGVGQRHVRLGVERLHPCDKLAERVQRDLVLDRLCRAAAERQQALVERVVVARREGHLAEQLTEQLGRHGTGRDGPHKRREHGLGRNEQRGRLERVGDRLAPLEQLAGIEPLEQQLGVGGERGRAVVLNRHSGENRVHVLQHAEIHPGEHDLVAFARVRKRLQRVRQALAQRGVVGRGRVEEQDDEPAQGVDVAHHAQQEQLAEALGRQREELVRLAVEEGTQRVHEHRRRAVLERGDAMRRREIKEDL
eukprot:Unigene15101_Nuclearia_a/m.45215 Unigene15101_Nuclearia_a/g.45215  ORF Unigene15101_Nuclearia_a/g.45215 Unigene15101_Nuclearia_a/m.45215 type:complete len:337 (+) Unigene15101_Nuclearia_a:158-1168(+)